MRHKPCVGRSIKISWWIVAARLIVCAGILVGGQGQASSPTSQEVIARAHMGRAEYIAVLGEVEAFAPTIESKDKLYPYISILDDLQSLGLAYGFDQSGGPLQTAALALTQAAVKWIQFDTDPLPLTKMFLKWSEDNTRFGSAQQQITFLHFISDKAGLRRWNDVVGELLSYMRSLHAQAFAVAGFEELQAAIVQKLLALDQSLDEPDVIALIQAAGSTAALQEITAFLEAKAVSAPNTPYLLRVMNWTIFLAEHIRQLPYSVPAYILEMPGQTLIDGVNKLIDLGEGLDAALVDRVVDLLQPNQVTELGNRLIQIDPSLLRPGQLEFVYRLTSKVEDRYLALGLIQQAHELDKLTSRLGVLFNFEKYNFEGTYSVVAGGRPGLLTIVNVGNANFIIGLSQYYGQVFGEAVNWSLFYVSYNQKENVFEAHHYAIDSAIFPIINDAQTYMTLALKPGRERGQGSVSGTFIDANGTPWLLMGEQVQTYPTYAGRGPTPVDSVDGMYQGRCNGRFCRLTLSQVGDRVAGIFDLYDLLAQIPLNYGYFDKQHGSVYVTSGEMESNRWGQVRGEFTANGETFHGAYIMGGDGLQFEMDLYRIH